MSWKKPHGRSYAPLDDQFDVNPKLLACSAGEMGVMACAFSFANRELTDGRIPRIWPERRFGREGAKLAARLVKDGRWAVRADGDFEIVGFLDHNRSRADVLEMRATKARNGQLGGHVSGESRRSKTEASASAGAEAKPKQVLQQVLKQNRSTGSSKLEANSKHSYSHSRDQNPGSPSYPGSLPAREKEPESLEGLAASPAQASGVSLTGSAVGEIFDSGEPESETLPVASRAPLASPLAGAFDAKAYEAERARQLAALAALEAQS